MIVSNKSFMPQAWWVSLVSIYFFTADQIDICKDIYWLQASLKAKRPLHSALKVNYMQIQIPVVLKHLITK